MEGFDLGAGFFPKIATGLKVAGLGEGAELTEAAEKLRGFPSISETPREAAAAVEAAKEAMGGMNARRGEGRSYMVGEGGCGLPRRIWGRDYSYAERSNAVF